MLRNEMSATAPANEADLFVVLKTSWSLWEKLNLTKICSDLLMSFLAIHLGKLGA